MKLKNIYLAITAFGALALSSCSDVLDVDSPSQKDATSVYSSAETTLQALYGAYNLFGQDSYTSRMCGVYMQNTDVEASAPSAGVPSSDRRAVWSLQSSAITGFNDIFAPDITEFFKITERFFIDLSKTVSFSAQEPIV